METEQRVISSGRSLWDEHSFSSASFDAGSFGGLEIVTLPPVAGVVGGGGVKSARDWAQDAGNLAFIHQEDQVATELLVTLVTQGFFHGNFQA